MIGRLFYLMIIGVLLFTVDGLGQNTWVKTFGGSLVEKGNSIVLTNDGGCVVTGWTSSNDGDFIGMNKGDIDIFVIKLNSNGNIIWKKTFGGGKESGNSIVPTKDGGYVLNGETSSNVGDFSGMNKGGEDIFVIKLNSNGDIVWKKTFGGSSVEIGRSITTTTDGGYVLSGRTNSNDGDFSGMNKGGEDIFVIKINSNGDTEWIRTFGGSDYESGYSITTTKDGGYVLNGETNSNDGDFSGMNKGGEDTFVIKLNSNGDTEWIKTFGGSDFETGYSITTTKDGGYLLNGVTNSNDGDFSGMNKGISDIFVIKLNSNGDIVWKKTFGGSGGESGSSITNTNDDGFVLTGSSSSNDGDFSGMNKGISDIFVIKLNSNGDIVWKKTFGGSHIDIGSSITTTIYSEYILTGRTHSTDGDFSGMNKGHNDIFLMKLDSNGNLNNTTSIYELSDPITTLSVHPNPFHNSTTISYKVDTPSNVRIELLNTLGQIIEVLREDYTDIGTYQLPLNVSTLSSGMYSVRMRSGSMNEVDPVWVVR
jgi:hypothetical protein